MQHVHDRQAGVETDEIRQFKRAHRVIGAQFHRAVDGLHRSHAFIQGINRLVDHWHEDAVYDEGREIFGRGGGFAEAVHHGFAGVEGFGVCGDAADQFDQLHHRDRVHEMEAHEFFRAVGAAG